MKHNIQKSIMRFISGKKILYLGVVVSFIITATIADALYISKVQSWKQQAGIMFKQSLEIELQKRDTAFVHYKVFMGQINWYLDNRPSDTLRLITDSGEREYIITKEKYENSLVKETLKRCIISDILEANPLIPDVLNEVWDSLLVSSGILMNSYTRILVANLNECTAASCTKGILDSFPVDSLLTYYLGECCEVEATGYVFYDWRDVFSIWEYLLLFILWIVIILLFDITTKGTLMLKEKLSTQDNVSIETKTPVITVKMEESHIYQLEERIFFDTKRKTLNNADGTIKISAQIAGLLELFLSSEDCRLTISEIDKGLWPDGSGTQDRIRSAISRLRSSLGEVTHLYIEYKNGVYQLKSSIYNEKAKMIK